ncbi:MAG: hypothetical protein A2W91_00770 [Bacteroidetes bacterium GWF2_38_335]|nr:MAG: hypothetical protein A2W91_00770 [Bacteroidetes bacterium GWF2_38_335]OFY78365.1 MAG: hypothetical protein A2281_04150 [Bacteroidetes bacterium RIFOXYA12_FULL_38_20]HBS87438.1 hypothetical protein [Bacteroidales bacterium]
MKKLVLLFFGSALIIVVIYLILSDNKEKKPSENDHFVLFCCMKMHDDINPSLKLINRSYCFDECNYLTNTIIKNELVNDTLNIRIGFFLPCDDGDIYISDFKINNDTIWFTYKMPNYKYIGNEGELISLEDNSETACECFFEFEMQVAGVKNKINKFRMINGGISGPENMKVVETWIGIQNTRKLTESDSLKINFRESDSDNYYYWEDNILEMSLNEKYSLEIVNNGVKKIISLDTYVEDENSLNFMPFYFGLDITDFNNYNDTMFIIRYNQKSKKFEMDSF